MNLQIPGMQVEKEDSDSDPEAIAARKERKRHQQVREKEQEAKAARAKEEQRKWVESVADTEQLLDACTPKDHPLDITALLESFEVVRPESFDDRLKLAAELCEKAKIQFKESHLDVAGNYWFCAMHCLDFTPRQQSQQPMENRTRLLTAVVPTLEHLSLVSSRLKDTRTAARIADLGVDVASKLAYKDSKDLRVRIRLRRAIARGDLRDFAKAEEEAGQVLLLSPDHPQASLIKRNAQIAQKRERLEPEQRWRGSLLKQLPKKAAASGTPTLVMLGAAVGVAIVAYVVGQTIGLL